MKNLFKLVAVICFSFLMIVNLTIVKAEEPENEQPQPEETQEIETVVEEETAEPVADSTEQIVEEEVTNEVTEEVEVEAEAVEEKPAQPEKMARSAKAPANETNIEEVTNEEGLPWGVGADAPPTGVSKINSIKIFGKTFSSPSDVVKLTSDEWAAYDTITFDITFEYVIDGNYIITFEMGNLINDGEYNKLSEQSIKKYLKSSGAPSHNARATFAVKNLDTRANASNIFRITIKDDQGNYYSTYQNTYFNTPKFTSAGLVRTKGVWKYCVPNKNGAAQFDSSYTGLARNMYGWFYVKKGLLDKTYTGLAKNQYGWFYVKKGVLDRTYTGLAKNQYGWFYVKKGVLDRTYTGLAKNQYGWFYVTKGVLDRKFTGVGKNQYGYFYVKKGVLDMSFTGTAKDAKGKTYKVVKGKATPK